MNRTDACICPYPDGDSSLSRMALEAHDLGFDSIVSVTAPEGGPGSGGVQVLRGAVVSEETLRQAVTGVRRREGACDVIMVDARDTAFNRGVISQSGVHILRNLYKQQRGAFDHVAARTAAENLVGIDISLYPLIHYRGSGRQRVLQRYAEILRLQRRYGFPVTLSSSAPSILAQRSVRDMAHLCSLFGMEEDEVSEALGAVCRLMDGTDAVRVVP